MREYNVRNFDKGLVDQIEDFSIPENAASRSLNWLTLGDKIELSGGFSVTGTEDTSAGKVTGFKVGVKADGTTLPIKTYGQKVEYYASGAWVESGTDLLGSDADGEDVAITLYTSLAGYQAWISSPNSSLYKMMLANPGNIIDQYFATNNDYKGGYIEAQNGRIYLWGYTGSNTILAASWKDIQNTTVYTTVTAEAVGALGSTNYTGTLAQRTGRRTVFSTIFTDGTQTIIDDRNGALQGDGTGTVNYATGAFDVTFNATTTGAVTVTYQYEDSAVQGLADFSYTSPTRVANEGFFLPQSTGGALLNTLFYEGSIYNIHENNAWIVAISADDTDATNQIYRSKLGMDNWRAAIGTGEGIYLIDTSNADEPRFKLVTLQERGDKVIPITFSYNINLSGYNFDDAVAYEWGDFLLFACKTSDSTFNNRTFVFNKIWKSFDVLGYRISCMDDNDGALWFGDSLSNNVCQAFTGYSANGAVVENYWEGKLTKMELDELKKYKRLTVRGQIGADQTIKVYIDYDDTGYTEIGDIEGDGSYVASTATAVIGSPLVGEGEIGGGGSGVSAFNYLREFRVRSPKFDEAKVKFVATGVGYASISEYSFYDIKSYGQKNLKRYRTT